MNLFVYGTLLDRSALEELIERELPGSPKKARLANYEKKETPFGYPIVLPKEGSFVEGLLWTGLAAEDLAKLDSYEDCDGNPPLYHRIEEAVTVEGQQTTAYLYRGNPEYWKDKLKSEEPA